MCQTFSPLSLAFGKHTKNYIKACKPCHHIPIHLWPRMPTALTSSSVHPHRAAKAAGLGANGSGWNKCHFAYQNCAALLKFWRPKKFSLAVFCFFVSVKDISPPSSSPYIQIFDYSLWNVSVTSTGIGCRMQTLIDSFLAIKCAYTATTHSKCTQISHFTF